MRDVDSFNWNLARVFFGISFLFSLLGIICNSLLLVVTIRTRSLRSTYNILIAVCAIGDILHQMGNLAQLPLLLDVYLEISSIYCVLIMFLPEMGIAIGCTCIFCIGLDRMLSVVFSIRYRSMNKRFYYFFLGFLIFAYCAYLSFLIAFFFRMRDVICQVVTPFLGPGYIWFTSGNVTVNVMSAVVYFIVWIGLNSRKDSTVMARIIKSLFIIVIVDTSGWFLTPGLTTLFHILNLEPNQFFAWTYFATIFIHIALSMKLFIYYSTSSEYRSAMRAILFKSTSSSIEMS